MATSSAWNNQSVKTPDIARYFNMGTTGAPEWEFAGSGFNAISESPQAQTTTTQYISDRSATSDIDSYKPKWEFDTDLIINQKCVRKLYDIGWNRLTGAGAQFELLIVDLFQGVEGQPNKYRARKQLVSAEIKSMDGQAGKSVHVTGTLHGVGDQAVGTFDTAAKKFTADGGV